MAQRLVVRETGRMPGENIHEEVIANHAYEAAALFMDGLRMAGWFVKADGRFKDKSIGYESWWLVDITSEDRGAIIVELREV